MKRFLSELQRRKVPRVAASYPVAAWIVLPKTGVRVQFQSEAMEPANWDIHDYTGAARLNAPFPGFRRGSASKTVL